MKDESWDFDFSAQAFTREITRRFGSEPADRFFAAFGGQRIYCPGKFAPNNRIYKHMGRDFGDWLFSTLGQGHFVIPMAIMSPVERRKREAEALFRQGHSCCKVAAHLHCHVRTAERIKARLVKGGKTL